jgi:diguanylate cyclase (GGDEF)-like protein/PAS domain S-box-containing protein
MNVSDITTWVLAALLVVSAVGVIFLTLSHRRYRRTHRELIAERERLLTVYEKNPAAVMTVDRDLTVTYANTKVSEIIGKDVSEVVGAKCHDTIVGQNEPCNGCLVQQVFATGRPASRIKHEMTTAGKENWLSQTWYPLRDANGEIDSVVEMATDISELKLDPLTSLPNRVLLRDRLDVALASARRHGLKVAVLFMDIDGFKEINDTLGHAAGDAVLTGVAERLRGIVRQDETLSRFGGDEFVLLLPAMESRSDAQNAAARVAEHLESPFVIGRDQVAVTMSVGIAHYDGGDETARQLLDRADEAMYEAKSVGGGCFAVSERSEVKTGV